MYFIKIHKVSHISLTVVPSYLYTIEFFTNYTKMPILAFLSFLHVKTKENL